MGQANIYGNENEVAAPKKKVFLGGTCNGSKWRDELIPLLKTNYFNPVVKNWTPECQVAEIKERESADVVLYVITPEMMGFYAIAEAVEDSNKRPAKTVFCYFNYGGQEFGKHQQNSLEATAKLIDKNGGKVFTNLNDVANYLNQ